MATSTGEAGGGLFQGGNATFDAQPFVAFQTNLLAKQQAKNDALDQYYRELDKNINPAGMRSVDVGGFMNKVNGIQQFYGDNRDAIINPKLDNGKAYTQFMSMHQDALGDIAASKNSAEDEKQLQTAKLSGKWNPTDDDVTVAHSIGSSIYDPTHYKESKVGGTPFTANDISLNVPQFDAGKQNEFSKLAFGEQKPTAKTYDEQNAVTDKSTGLMNVPYSTGYTPEQIKQIGLNANGAVGTGLNNPAKIFYEGKMNDPQWMLQANAAYQQAYGNKAVITTPAQAAEADYLMKASNYKETGSEVRENPMAMAQYNQGREDARKGMPTYQEKQDVTFIPKYVDNLISNSQGNPLLAEKQISVDANLEKAFDRKGAKLTDIAYNPTANTFTPKYVKVDEHGQIIPTSDNDATPQEMTELEQPMSRQQFEINLGSKLVSKGNESKEGAKIFNNQQPPANNNSAPKGTTPFTAKDGNTYYINSKTKQVFTKEGKEIQ